MLPLGQAQGSGQVGVTIKKEASPPATIEISPRKGAIYTVPVFYEDGASGLDTMESNNVRVYYGAKEKILFLTVNRERVDFYVEDGISWTTMSVRRRYLRLVQGW